MLVIMAVSFIVSMLAGIVGLILCVIGLVVTIPLSVLFLTVFQYHLYGQLAREHPMYGSPSAAPAPLVPSDPEGTGDDVPGAELHASEQTVIIPPAPQEYSQSETAGDEIATDEVVDTGATSDDEAASVVAVDERIDATAGLSEESIKNIASEVSESTDEIATSVDEVVDEVVEAGTDVVDEAVDEVNTIPGSVAGEADSNDDDSDPNQKPEA